MSKDDSQRVAAAAQTAVVGFIRALIETADSPTAPGGGPAYNSAVLTGCLYGVIRVMANFRGASLTPEKFRAMVIASVNSALSQVLPTADKLEAEDEESFLRLMADTSCRSVQTLADDLHERGAGGPVCPMDGIVSGLFAGAVFVAGHNRDREAYPHPGAIADLLEPLLRETLRDLATHEAADAMGEAQGHG